MSRALPHALLLCASTVSAGSVALRCDSPEKQAADVLAKPSVDTSVKPVESPAPEPSSSSVKECDEEVLRPEFLERSSQVTFPERYQHGEYTLGVCIFRVTVTTDGRLDGIHLVRPNAIPEDLERYMRKNLESFRYEPATLCGRAVPYEMTVTVSHCPIESAEQWTPDV